MVMCCLLGILVSKIGQRKNRDVSRDCAVVEQEIMVNKVLVLTASATGEPSANGDKSAMVA